MPPQTTRRTTRAWSGGTGTAHCTTTAGSVTTVSAQTASTQIRFSAPSIRWTSRLLAGVCFDPRPFPFAAAVDPRCVSAWVRARYTLHHSGVGPGPLDQHTVFLNWDDDPEPEGEPRGGRLAMQASAERLASQPRGCAPTVTPPKSARSVFNRALLAGPADPVSLA